MAYDLIVIGGGPGGYNAAIRAAQLGMQVAVVEKDKTLGGTCLNVGCIPSKALLESSELFSQATHRFETHGIVTGDVSVNLPQMMKRKDSVVGQLTRGLEYLFKKNKITWLKGTGTVEAAGKVRVTAADSTTASHETKNILIATGSAPASLPGVELDGEVVVTSTEALAFPEIPKQLVVIGGGVIGLELGSVWKRLGSRVTVLEFAPQILGGTDTEVAKAAEKIFIAQGIEFVLEARVKSAKKVRKGAEVVFDLKGAEQKIHADRVLVSTGRRPYTDGLGLQEAGVKMDERGRVLVDKHWRTNVAGIYAVGDVIPGMMLAHKAEDEGVAAVEIMAGKAGHVTYEAIPGIVYTHPEVANVGQTEEQLKKAGIEYKKGTFPYSPNGRAKALGDTEGFVKILADAKTDRILGAHIIGARAGELIAELAVAMEFKASAEDVARSAHAHPTLSEIVKQAALAVDGRATQM